MSKLLKVQVAIPCIVSLFIGGAVLYTSGQVTWGFPVWSIAIFWLTFFLVFQRQWIDISVANCELDIIESNKLRVKVYGWIVARNKEELDDLELRLASGHIVKKSNAASSIPDEVGEISKRFEAFYPITFQVLEDGREGQQKGKAVDYAQVLAKTKNIIWESPKFTIPTGVRKIKRGIFSKTRRVKGRH